MLQQSEGTMHGKPSSAHWSPQMPPWQMPLQQSDGSTQPVPSGLHISKPHVKLFGSQKPSQQSESSEQEPPSGWQLVLHVNVAGSQSWLQQSESPMQGELSGRQPPHVSLAMLQSALQHWEPDWQNSPSWEQGSQTPALQKPPQQSLATLHGAPCCAHPQVSVTLSHAALQHWLACPHWAPSERHAGPPHFPAVQAAEQHWAAREHAAPSGSHD